MERLAVGPSALPSFGIPQVVAFLEVKRMPQNILGLINLDWSLDGKTATPVGDRRDHSRFLIEEICVLGTPHRAMEKLTQESWHIGTHHVKGISGLTNGRKERIQPHLLE